MEESKNINQGLDIVSTTDALLGALAKDPWVKENDARDVAEAMGPDAVWGALEAAIKVGKEEFKARDFYVEVFIRQDPKLPANHAKPQANAMPFCPTPTHDAAVWRIRNGEPEYLWMVPSVEYGLEMIANPLAVKDKELFKDLLDFMDGSLRRRAKQMNGELI